MTQGNSIITVELDSLAVGGECVGRVTAGPQALLGKKAFVPWAVPGELVEARLLEDHKKYLRTEALEVKRASPARVDAACPLFRQCGGCQLQHIDLKAQRDFKRGMVESMLRHQANLTPLAGVALIGGDLPGFDYRRRITLHVSSDGKIGFYRCGSGDVVDMENCPISSQAINAAFCQWKRLFQEAASYLASVVLEDRMGRVALGLNLREPPDRHQLPAELLRKFKDEAPDLSVLASGKPVFSQMREGLRGVAGDAIPIGAFSQVNHDANLLLRETVVSEVRGEEITDLYAGSGNLSFPLAAQGRRVVAVESDRRLVVAGQDIAKDRKLGSGITFVNQSCESYVQEHALCEVVLLDPPRSGAKEVVRFIDPAVSTQVIYVSCNLPSLCRDLAALHAQGYTLKRTLVLDMFPQTHHVETISILEAN